MTQAWWTTLLVRAGQYLCWHLVCLVGGVLTVTHLPTSCRKSAAIVVGIIVTLPHLLDACKEIISPHGGRR